MTSSLATFICNVLETEDVSYNSDNSDGAGAFHSDVVGIFLYFFQKLNRVMESSSNLLDMDQPVE